MFTAKGLQWGTRYLARVRASCGDGNWGPYSDPSKTILTVRPQKKEAPVTAAEAS